MCLDNNIEREREDLYRQHEQRGRERERVDIGNMNRERKREIER